MDVLSLIGAIVLITIVVQLRAIAAMPFARARARFVPAAAPAALADLYAAAATELAALGFESARWVHLTTADAATAPLQAVHVHAASGAALWLAAPAANAPNRLVAFYVTRMRDGRTLITQPYDCYFELFARLDTKVQSIAAPTFAAQWAAHQAFVAAQGEADAGAVEPAQLLAFGNDWTERQRQHLLDCGDLRPVDADLARPSLSMAWRARLAMRRAPKPPADPRPVPAARIALMAMQFERIRGRAPARSVEFTLFALSVAAFMVLGAVLWNLETAWIILVVVVIHELGHFLAMRAFGYRNVHMMALPLVGGVAIGQETDPSAHRSAWMSLMGPLPGILIGWTLLIAVWSGHWPEQIGDAAAWASVFLLVNYLNVLPFPPLDGGHVVQALLPARRAWLEVGFIAVACSVGAWLAWSFDLTLLALIAALQLLTLGGRWQAQRALAQLAQNPPARELPRVLRLKAVATALEGLVGPATLGKARVEQTLDVLQRLDRRPMRIWQTLLVGVVYATLLIVPVGAAVAGYAMRDLVGSGSDHAESAAADASRRAELKAAAKAKSDRDLMADLVAAPDWANAPGAPADEAAIAASAQRLGMPVPEPLLTLYRQHNGVEALSIEPIEGLRPAASDLDEWADLLDGKSVEIDVVAADGEFEQASLPIRELRGWLRFGGYDGDSLLVNPNAQGPQVQVLELSFESPVGYRSVREWLESRWIGDQESRHFAAAAQLRQQQAMLELKDADWAQLLDVLEPKIPFPYKLLADLPEPAPAANPAALRAAEQRLGSALPADYRALLELHNGIPMLQLGPIEQVQLLDAEALRNNQWLRNLASMPTLGTAVAPGAERLQLGAPEDLADCWGLDRRQEGPPGALVYCPPGHAHAGYIDLGRRARYSDLRSYVLVRAAQASAYAQP